MLQIPDRLSIVTAKHFFKIRFFLRSCISVQQRSTGKDLGRSVLINAVVAGFLFPCGSGEAASVQKPAIVTRKEWGSKAQPISEFRRQEPSWITIHHAGEFWKAGADPAEFVRHMQIWGQNRPQLEKAPRNTYWPDLPYHFLIAPDGRIFEGRLPEYEPETNTNYPVNGNIGVEMMGDFEKQRPSLAQIRSCVAITAWLCQKYNIKLDHVRTHMDAAPNQTDCPGKDFNRYFLDGQFKNWVKLSLQGAPPRIEAGPPLPDGPCEMIDAAEKEKYKTGT